MPFLSGHLRYVIATVTYIPVTHITKRTTSLQCIYNQLSCAINCPSPMKGTSTQWIKCSSPLCPLFRGSTAYPIYQCSMYLIHLVQSGYSPSPELGELLEADSYGSLLLSRLCIFSGNITDPADAK